MEYTFIADEILHGSPNRAQGRRGQRFSPAIPLNNLAWFKRFRERQSNFSLGIREIAGEHVVHLLEFLAASKV